MFCLGASASRWQFPFARGGRCDVTRPRFFMRCCRVAIQCGWRLDTDEICSLSKSSDTLTEWLRGSPRRKLVQNNDQRRRLVLRRCSRDSSPRGLTGDGFGRWSLFERLSDDLSLDQIKCLKGVWWMPWQQEAMKDVILCDKLWGAENRL